jgi:cytochrome c6
MSRNLIIAGLLFAALIAACSDSPEKPAPASAPTSAEPNLVAGASTFKTYCVACHGADGKLGLNGAKDFSQSPLTLEQRIEVISTGRAGTSMVAYKELLTAEEIRDVAAYTLTFKDK